MTLYHPDHQPRGNGFTHHDEDDCIKSDIERQPVDIETKIKNLPRPHPRDIPEQWRLRLDKR